jgi:hypothetical protein
MNHGGAVHTMFGHRLKITLNQLITTGQLLTILLVTAVLLSVMREAKENGLLSLSHFIQPSNAPENVCMASSSTPLRNYWFLVPNWLAGTWQARSELVVDAYDYRRGVHTIESPTQIDLDRKSVIGMQKDSFGRVWYYAGTPYVRKIETGGFVEYQQMERVSLVQSSQFEVTVNCLATVTRVDKGSGQIAQVYREETITTYSPLADSMLRARYVINDFDMQGRAISSSQAYSTQTRVKSFETVDQDERGDLRNRFQQFLIANGLSGLLANR